MIVVFHGDDQAKSREEYLTQKKKSKNPVELRGDKVSLTDIAQAVEGNSLFFEIKEIFIENLLSVKKSVDTSQIISYLKENGNKFDFYVWEPVEITKASLSKLGAPTVRLFKLPQSLFVFLDQIKPGNKNLVNLFHDAIKNSSPEIVFYMMIRQFRLLVYFASSSTSQIEEVRRLAPWQEGKLRKQAAVFDKEKLFKCYKKLAEIDHTIKTGKTPFDLIQSIDIFLLSL